MDQFKIKVLTKDDKKLGTGHDFYMEGKEGSCISATKSTNNNNNRSFACVILTV